MRHSMHGRVYGNMLTGNGLKLLQCLAVFCSYLIMTIPAVSAVSIRTFMPGSAEPSGEFTLSASDKVERTFSVYPVGNKYDEVWVQAGVVGKDPTYTVKKIYLYRCGNSDPVTCSENAPLVGVNYLSGQMKTFRWTSDLAVGNTANFMT